MLALRGCEYQAKFMRWLTGRVEYYHPSLEIWVGLIEVSILLVPPAQLTCHHSSFKRLIGGRLWLCLRTQNKACFKKEKKTKKIPEPVLVDISPSVQSLFSKNQRKHVKHSFQTKTSFNQETTNNMNTLNHAFKITVFVNILSKFHPSLTSVSGQLSQTNRPPASGFVAWQTHHCCPSKKGINFWYAVHFQSVFWSFLKTNNH